MARTLLMGVLTLNMALVGIQSAYAQKPELISPIDRKSAREAQMKDRKASAQRLKQRYQEARHRHLFNADGTPKGYNRHEFSGQASGRQHKHPKV